jgi:hypothetical protein
MSDARPISISSDKDKIILEFKYRGIQRTIHAHYRKLSHPTFDNLFLFLFDFEGYHCLKPFEDFLFYNREFEVLPFVLTNKAYWNFLKNIESVYGSLNIGKYSSIAPDKRAKKHSPNEREQQSIYKLFRELLDYNRVIYDIELMNPFSLVLQRHFALINKAIVYDIAEINKIIDLLFSSIDEEEMCSLHIQNTSSDTAVEFSALQDLLTAEQINNFLNHLNRKQYIISFYESMDSYNFTIYDNNTSAKILLTIPIITDISSTEIAISQDGYELNTVLGHLISSSNASKYFIRESLNFISKYFGGGASIG